MIEPLLNHPDIEQIKAKAAAEGIRIPPKFLYGLQTAEELRMERLADDIAEDTLP
jgi:hypothetical protein